MFYIVWTTVSSGPSMVKSSISTNILLLSLDVTGARTTSKTPIYLPSFLIQQATYTTDLNSLEGYKKTKRRLNTWSQQLV